MSNVNNPHGLRPLGRTVQGGALETRNYTKAAAYGYAIYKWDPVTLLAGVLNGPANGLTAGTTRYLGVALSYSLASLLATLPVIVAQDAVYEIMGDGSGATTHIIDPTTIGYNANMTFGTAGGGVTRDNSGVKLAESTIDVTATLDLNILGILSTPDNVAGTYGRVECVINKHLLNKEVTKT